MPELYPTAVDVHTHLDFPCFDEDRNEVVDRARKAGVGTWLIAGANPTNWGGVVEVARETGGLAAVGVHPWWALSHPMADPTQVTGIAAIGEIGLDWIVAKTPDQRQIHTDVFRRQLALARDLNLPVVLHCVRAMTELLHILRTDGLPRAGGMVHAWSGPADQVSNAVDLGLFLSFGATLTRSRKVAECAQRCPASHLLIETDAPDQPLERGLRGEPAHLVAIAVAMGDIRGTSGQTVMDQTGRNARRLFPFPDAP